MTRGSFDRPRDTVFLLRRPGNPEASTDRHRRSTGGIDIVHNTLDEHGDLFGRAMADDGRRIDVGMVLVPAGGADEDPRVAALAIDVMT